MCGATVAAMRVSSGRRRGVGCLIVIPVIFLALGGIWLYFSIARVSNQATAIGVIVDVTSSRDSDGDTIYRPVVEFVAPDGVTHSFVGRTGSSRRPAIGTTIEVLYDPGDPAGATEKTFTNLWLFPIAFAGFGLLFLIAMTLGPSWRRRGGSGGQARNVEEAAAALDAVLGQIPDIGPPGPADRPRARATVGDAPYTVGRRSAAGGGATAEFRRAEASISDDGTMRYRIVAKDEEGNEYYSGLLDEDPTVDIMKLGNEVELVEGDDGWVVGYEPPGKD